MQPESKEAWPSLPFQEWKETYTTLQMWTQIVGKILLKLSPFANHWWHVALHVTPRGLATQSIPYHGRYFDISFDFIDHTLTIRTSEGEARVLALAPRSVSDFYSEVMDCLQSLGINLKISMLPSECPDPVRFDRDLKHSSYDRGYANRFWKILLQSDQAMKRFQSGFLGKASPVHFFWGSFDLTVTRFSGKRAPPNPAANIITRIGYSHEDFSCGFWPGSANILEPAYYAYAFPQPAGFEKSPVLPSKAFFNPGTKGYILRYEDVRNSSDPHGMLNEFFQSTYELAANLGNWDRAALEQEPPAVRRSA